MIFFKKKIDTDKILDTVEQNRRFTRYLTLLIGLFILAISYNLFFLPNDIVYGGVSGMAIILNKELSIDPATFILVSSIILLIISYFLLGYEKTKGSILGSLLFPVFIKLTSELIAYTDLQTKFDHDDLLLVVIFGAVIHSFGCGIILKEGFSTGGTDILNQMAEKYLHVSLGSAMLMTDGIIVLSGLFFFGPAAVMYAILVLYIMSVLVDRVILGISESKMFYIITNKEEEVHEFIMDNLNAGLTVFDAQGGFMHNDKKVLMCVIPSKDYFKLKEGILRIDEDAFCIVTDSYQVSGGH